MSDYDEAENPVWNDWQKQRNGIFKDLQEKLDAGLIDDGNLPDAFVELMRFCDHKNEDGRAFQSYMEQVTHKVLPGWDFEKHPIIFLIADVDDVNAGALADYKPTIIFFNKALLELIDGVENALMHILTHENGHQIFRDSVGRIDISEPEEMLVNLPGIKWMCENGYDPRSALDFAKKINEVYQGIEGRRSLPNKNDFDLLDMTIAVADEHMSPGFDVDFLNNSLTAYRNKVVGTYKGMKVERIPEEMLQLFDRATHVSHVQKVLNELPVPFEEMDWKDQLELIIEQIKVAGEGYQKNRAEDLLELLEDVDNDVDDTSRRMAIEMVSAMKGKPILFRELFGTINMNLMDQEEDVPIPPLTEISEKIEAISQSTSKSEFLRNVSAFYDAAERLGEDYPLDTISWPTSYQFPKNISNINFSYKENAGNRPPWNDHVLWAIEALEEKNEVPATALIMMGVEDPRLFNALPDDVLTRVLSIFNPNAVSLSKNFNSSIVKNYMNIGPIPRLSSPDRSLDDYDVILNKEDSYPAYEDYRKWRASEYIINIIHLREAKLLSKEMKERQLAYSFDGELPFDNNEGFENWFNENREHLSPSDFMGSGGLEIQNFQSRLIAFNNESEEDKTLFIERYKKSIARGYSGRVGNYKGDFLRLVLQHVEPFEKQSDQVVSMFKAQLEQNGKKGREIVRSFFLNSDDKPGFRQLMEAGEMGTLLMPDNAYIRFIAETKGLFSIEEKASILSHHVPFPRDHQWWNEILETEQPQGLDSLVAFVNASQQFSRNVRDLGEKTPKLAGHLAYEDERDALFAEIAMPYFQGILGYNYLGGLDLASFLENPPDLTLYIAANKVLVRDGDLDDDSCEAVFFEERIETDLASFFSQLLSPKTKETFAKWTMKNEISTDFRSIFDVQEDDDPVTVFEDNKNSSTMNKYVTINYADAYFTNHAPYKEDPPSVPASDAKTIRDLIIKHVATQEDWPSEATRRTKIYKNIDELDFFPSYSYQEEFRDQLINDLKSEKDLDVRLVALKNLLDGNPVKDPKMRKEAAGLWVETLYAKQRDASLGKDGLDDGDPAYKAAIMPELEWAEKHIPAAERYRFFVQLSDKLETQRELSYRMRDSFDLTGQDFERSDKYFRAGEAVLVFAAQKPERRQELLDFLISPPDRSSVRKFGNWLSDQRDTIVSAKERSRHIVDDLEINAINENSFIEAIGLSSDPEYYTMQAQTIYNNFWQAPLAAKIVILDQLLMTPDEKDYSSDNDASLSRAGRKESDEAYRRTYNHVVDRLIDDEIDYAKETRIALEAFKNVLPPNERALFLSTMLAASDMAENSSQNLSSGERLAIVLEMYGHAFIKFGQGVGNHPDVPMDIRMPMVRLTHNASPSPRWDLWERYEDIVDPRHRAGVLRMGPTRGAASYNEVVRLEKKDGTHSVLSMQRPYIERLADAGFEQLRKFVQELKRAEELDSEVADVADAVLGQAQKMAENETDIVYRSKQVKQAQKYYNGMEIETRNHTFNFETARWQAYGVDREDIPNRLDRKEWCDQDEMPGVHFNELEKGDYKEAVAESVLTAEFYVWLSGMPLDHDRHVAQLRIDRATNHIGLFDHGALDLEVPSKEDKQMLAQVLVAMAQNIGDGESVPDVFCRQLKEIKREKGEIPEYLVKVERAALALTPFFEEVKPDRIKHIISSLHNAGIIDRDILDTKIAAPIVGKVKLSTALKAVLPKSKDIKISWNDVPEPPEPVVYHYDNNKPLLHPVIPGIKPKEEHIGAHAPNGNAYDLQGFNVSSVPNPYIEVPDEQMDQAAFTGPANKFPKHEL